MTHLDDQLREACEQGNGEVEDRAFTACHTGHGTMLVVDHDDSKVAIDVRSTEDTVAGSATLENVGSIEHDDRSNVLVAEVDRDNQIQLHNGDKEDGY